MNVSLDAKIYLEHLVEHVKTNACFPRGGDPSVLDANYPPNKVLAGGPLGGGHWRGGSGWGDLGCWGAGGGHTLPLPPLALPLTIPSP